VRRIVITLPAHNEEKTIGAVLQTIFRSMKAYAGPDWRVVVVDDCSSDNSAAIAEQNGAKVIRLNHKAGLAAVFRREMETAIELEADWIVHIDSDGQHPAQAIPTLLNHLEQGVDLAIGSRFLLNSPGSKPLIEQFESRSFSSLLSWITGHTFTDAHSGFRAFTSQVAQEVPISSTFSYAREQLFRAACRGYTIKDVPISVAARTQGKSRLIKNRTATMLNITGRYCSWYWQEIRSVIKVPVIIGWGLAAIALSWILRLLHRLGITISRPANTHSRS